MFLQVLFKANLIFRDFSRQSCIFKYFSSLCVPCYHIVLSVPCSLVMASLDKADLLALLCVKFSCAFVTFSYGFLGLIWYLVVLIPDLCLLPCYKPNSHQAGSYVG